MAILGFRCSSKDFSYAILSGTQQEPVLIEVNTIKYPSGYSHPEQLNWFYQEIGEILGKHEIRGIGIKGTEPMGMKGKNYGARMEAEGMIVLQAGQKRVKYIKRKVKSTIAKDLGLKGKGKYLSSKVDYTKIPEFEKKSQNQKEAIQVSLSMLN